MTDSYGTMLAQPSAGDQRNRLAALLMEQQMGGPVGAPQPGVSTPSAMQPVPGQAPASGAPATPGAMPGAGQPVAGAMPPPTGGAASMPAAPPLPGVTPGGGQPGQPLPLRY